MSPIIVQPFAMSGNQVSSGPPVLHTVGGDFFEVKTLPSQSEASTGSKSG